MPLFVIDGKVAPSGARPREVFNKALERGFASGLSGWRAIRRSFATPTVAEYWRPDGGFGPRLCENPVLM